ncbi:MAG: hypothetical protein HQK63_10050 [Desulfamplus sp.]|nr:hypothetical protein [Desulfamplus sp.]
MNTIIIEHFNSLEASLIENNYIVSYKIIRRETSYAECKIRFKVIFVDGSEAEFFEYLVFSNKTLSLSKYSFHWQDVKGNLIYRWDNAPHFPALPNPPHHRHNPDNSVVGIIKTPDIFDIIKEIEKILEQSQKG